jgi:hypothetical protein
VGENGPELVYFNGGEGVLSAERTDAVLSSGGSYTITVNVAGNADESTAGRIAQQVKDVLEELEEDRRRRAYV